VVRPTRVGAALERFPASTERHIRAAPCPGAPG
jgi:hypothetical protein